MIETKRARCVNVRINEEHILEFAPKDGAYFIAWGVDADGFLTLESGEHTVVFAAGEWISLGADEYKLKKDLH
jgi:hypothetical protein